MMFSKFGNLLTYQFHILLSKDKILSPEKKTKSSIRIPDKHRRSPVKSINEVDRAIGLPESNKSLSPKPMSMFRSQSREEFYRSNSNKDRVPPVGYYNCKYNYITKSSKSVNFNPRVKTRSRVSNASQLSDPFNKYTPPTRVASVSFKKQIPRKDIFTNSLNEKRFSTVNLMPEVCSNFKKTSTPDMSRIKGRDNLIKEPEYCNSYNADFTLVTQDIGRVHDFSKYPQRKPLFQEKEDLRSYEVNWKSVEKNTIAIDFSRTTSKFKENYGADTHAKTPKAVL